MKRRSIKKSPKAKEEEPKEVLEEEKSVSVTVKAIGIDEGMEKIREAFVPPAESGFDAPRKWKNLGGGHFHLKRLVNGKWVTHIIKPKQPFTAKPSEVPKAFRDVVVLVEPNLDAPEEEVPAEAITDCYEVVSHPTKFGKFNVINSTTGKALNAQPLDEATAKTVLEGLG